MSAPLRVVVLEHPGGGEGGRLLERVLAMREAGYRRRHGEVSVASDPYDAVSTHVLVCREDDTGLAPLLAFRSTVASDWAEAGLPFPLTAALAGPAWAEHARAVEAELEGCRRAGHKAVYAGLWTTDPGLRSDRRLFRDVWALNAALLVGLVRDGGIGQVLVGAIPSQGTDRLLARYGMVPMEHDGEVLSRIAVPHIPGETAVLMRLEAFSAEVLAEAEGGWARWEGRRVIRDGDGGLARRRAA